VDASQDAVDPADFGLPSDLDKALRGVITSAEARLVEATLTEVESAWSHELLLHAIAGGHHERLPELRARALYPTTDGRALSFAQLAERKTVAFAAQPLEGALASGEPVIRAVDPSVKAALAALGKKRRDVTAALAAQIEARRAREKVRPVEAVRVAGRPLRRRAFEVDGVEGEVAFTSGTGATLAVFHERRLMVKDALAVPAGVEAAVNNDALKPVASQENVRRDTVYKKTVALVLGQVDAFAAETAEAWAAMTKGERAKLAPILVRVATWLIGRGVRHHDLFGVPLLAATDGRDLTFADLLRAQHERGHVPVADRDGTLLDEALWVWRPRPGELLGLPRPLRPEDATAALVWADRVRAAPSVPPGVDLPARWRERVVGEDLEGEAVVAQGPFVLELVRDGRLLETATFDHPMGGRARVACVRFVPDPLRARVVRDDAFQSARAAAEAALERAVARLLREGTPHDWGDLVEKAIAWRFGTGGPVAEALNGLELFRDHTDSPVTLGRVVAEASSRGSVPVLEPGQRLESPPPLVLWAAGPDRRRLGLLKVALADLGDVAQRDAKRRDRREERRLPSLRYGDRAILRLPVDEDGWRGELAFPQPPDRAGAIVLARDGIAVDQFHVADLGVAGVLEHPELPVSPGWENAVLDDAWRERLRRLADRLFARLAVEGPRLEGSERETAAYYALRHLARAGVASPQHLDRLEGLGDTIARAALFVTLTGERLDLRSVASRVVREPPVPVLPFAADGGARFALRALVPGAPWVAALEAALGKGSIAVIGTAAEWRRREAEREPEPDDPVARGIARLRRELERLSGAAVGRLDKDVLQDVRVHRGGGTSPVWYDAARGLGLVDPGHAGVGRALSAAGADEDALYVVLAGLVGAVNRALDAVTDEDERALIGTLLERVDTGPAR
jgi:hypothetical protein